MPTEPVVRIHNLQKHFEEGFAAVKNLDLEIHEGELLALLGPSGCGKTTTLRLIAGLERPDGGTVSIRGKKMADGATFVPPEKRGVGIVFQDLALFPHLSVMDNVGFGLHQLNKAERRGRALEDLSLVGLENLGERYPHELSGGQRQRVALARAIAPRPAVILLDEPFSNLDEDLRLQLREDVRAILEEVGATVVFVTHDQEEAMHMGNRIAVMNHGSIIQIGEPEEIFSHPKSRFVAEFLGQTEFLPGTIVPGGIETELGHFPQQVDLQPGTEVEIALRADDITFVRHTEGTSIVVDRQFRGAFSLYRLQLPTGRRIYAMTNHSSDFRPGDKVRVRLDPGHRLAVFKDGEVLG
jgi:iron(III) transport system ATP-binding protein